MAMKDMGGFLGDKSVWQKMAKNLQKGSHLAVKVGFFDKYYGPENDNISVAQVAQFQEEGTDKIPSRPFLRMYLFKLEQDGKLVKEMADKIHLVAMGKMTWTAFYNDLGKEAQEDVKKVIEAWTIPPNAPYTIALKDGRDDPLVDSKLMMNSVEHQIGRK